jgi:hypothetical protein
VSESESQNTAVNRLLPRSLIAGVVGLALSLGCWVAWPDAFLRGYLVGYLFCLGIPLGCLAIEMIYRLTGGRWGAMLHRPMTAAMQTLPVTAVFFLPIAAGLKRLYPWMNSSFAPGDFKRYYLDEQAFLARAIIYFAVWIAFALGLSYLSRRLERTGNEVYVRRLGILSGPGLALFALAETFAAIDWQMSLEPHWYSTIFPVIFGLSHLLAGFAFATLATTTLAPRATLASPIGKLVLQDVGSLLLAFIVLGAYVSFSQFLLIWTGNLPEETQWYLPRIAGGWQVFAMMLGLLQFATPFLFLLSKRIKRNARAIGGVACFVLVMHFIDVYWQVMPAFSPGDFPAAWRETLAAAAATLGIGGMLFASFLFLARGIPDLPITEPTPPAEETDG